LSDDIIFLLPTEGYLVLPNSLLMQCNSFCQNQSFKPESGGILLGSYRGPHIEITDITEPSRLDRQSRCGFIRKSPHHVKADKDAWKASKGTAGYIGEWHTHPEAIPTPSYTDKYEWKITLPMQPLILMIIGTDGLWVGYRNKYKKINGVSKFT